MARDLDTYTEDIVNSDNEHELAENLAAAIDFAFGGFEHRIEAMKTDEYLTNDAMIKLHVNDTVYLLTVQEDRR